MKKELVAGISIALLIVVLITIFYPNSKNEENNLQNESEGLLDPSIQSAKQCSNMNYPGAGALGHGSGEDCYATYMNSFTKNNSEICPYLQLDFDKAICFGSSVKSKEEVKCKELNKKDICMINAVKKLSKYNLVEKQDSLDLCEQIENKTLKLVCVGFVATRFEDINLCSFGEEDNLVCLADYIRGRVYENKENILLCNSLFSGKEIVMCYNLGVPNYWNQVNTTGVANMTYYHLLEIADEHIYYLSNRKEVRETLESGTDYIYYKTNNFICNSIFQEESLVDENCEKISEGDSHLEYPNIPKWGYFSDYFRP